MDVETADSTLESRVRDGTPRTRSVSPWPHLTALLRIFAAPYLGEADRKSAIGYHAALPPLGWALERTSQREETETESSTVAQARDATRRHTRRDATGTSYNSTPRRPAPRPGRDAQRTREPARQTPAPRVAGWRCGRSCVFVFVTCMYASMYA